MANHCSVMGPTNPNRLYLWTGMIDPNGTGGGPIIDNSEPAAGFTWTTYPERLQAAGITWKVYQEADNYDDNALAWFAQYKNAAAGNPLYDRGIATVSDLVAAFQNDVTSGALPQVSWLIRAGSRLGASYLLARKRRSSDQAIPERFGRKSRGVQFHRFHTYL